MMQPGDVVSYIDMCKAEGVNLQRGMNFRLRGRYSVILMSIRSGAPYADRVEGGGRVLIYEGHDIAQRRSGPNPKTIDQPAQNPGGSLTQNGLFYKAATDFKGKGLGPEKVKVYEKIRSGIWVYNGIFDLVDAWKESSSRRKVFKFKLEITDGLSAQSSKHPVDIEHERFIPTSVKLEVWKRDKGICIQCGSADNLHFDHVIPYSRGGSSLVVENIQILCARHNLEKRDRIV